MNKKMTQGGPRSTKHTDVQQEHPRVAARLKGIVKNLGIKPKKKKPKRDSPDNKISSDPRSEV